MCSTSNQTREDDDGITVEEVDQEVQSSSGVRQYRRTVVSGTLNLRGGSNSEKRITWDESVIDNENLNRAKSKVCCVFHPQNTEDYECIEDDDDTDPNGPNAYEKVPIYKRKDKTSDADR